MAEKINSRVLDFEKLIYNFFAKKEICDTIKSRIQDIPQAETSEVGGTSSVYITNGALM